MKPGGKCRLAPKAANLAKELNEYFLGQVFRFGYIPGHAQAKRIYAAIVTLVKLFEGFHIAVGSLLRQLVVRSSRCLSFACSHLFLRSASCLAAHFKHFKARF